MKAGQTGSEKREGYIYGIDGLRAVAVLMVFAYHCDCHCERRFAGGYGIFCYIRISDYKDFDHRTGEYPYDKFKKFLAQAHEKAAAGCSDDAACIDLCHCHIQ